MKEEKRTKEFQLQATALVNGKKQEKILDSISGTEKFEEAYLHDLAADAFEKVFPNAKIEIQTVKLIPVGSQL